MHSPSSPITSFRAGLSALSLSEQKAIFDCLPAAVQFSLWQDRLLEGASELSDSSQCKLLRELSDILSPESYSDQERNQTAIAQIDGMSELVERVFPDHSVYQKYTQRLGDNACETTTIEQEEDALPTCTCSSSRSCMLRHNDCGAIQECLAGGCNPTVRGCGILWLQACDGLCTGNWC